MKKFYKTTLTIEILSQEPGPEESTLQEIADECDDGSWSGAIKDVQQEEVDAKTMLDLLQGQGTDPQFFDLTKDGEEEDT